jgi:hypothetical protein
LGIKFDANKFVSQFSPYKGILIMCSLHAEGVYPIPAREQQKVLLSPASLSGPESLIKLSCLVLSNVSLRQLKERLKLLIGIVNQKE